VATAFASVVDAYAMISMKVQTALSNLVPMIALAMANAKKKACRG
jgi:hypothetical protein